jgi:hypothetical protein
VEDGGDGLEVGQGGGIGIAYLGVDQVGNEGGRGKTRGGWKLEGRMRERGERKGRSGDGGGNEGGKRKERSCGRAREGRGRGMIFPRGTPFQIRQAKNREASLCLQPT